MRYGKDRKLRTRSRIVKEASRVMRESGADGGSVNDVMRLAGLTHGGFYNHFGSRDELVVEAFSAAMDESIARWTRRVAAAPPGSGLEAIIDAYLSPAHRDSPALGCAFPSMAADIARSGNEAKSAFDNKLNGLIDLVERQLKDIEPAAARPAAMGIIAILVGSILLARASGERAPSDEMLDVGRLTARRLVWDPGPP
jgi:TetR/AcrR family transcriptional repressor of nem operon